jgi:hypothetical protein
MNSTGWCQSRTFPPPPTTGSMHGQQLLSTHQRSAALICREFNAGQAESSTRLLFKTWGERPLPVPPATGSVTAMGASASQLGSSGSYLFALFPPAAQSAGRAFAGHVTAAAAKVRGAETSTALPSAWLAFVLGFNALKVHHNSRCCNFVLGFRVEHAVRDLLPC